MSIAAVLRRNRARLLLILYVAGLAYLSLYPFDFLAHAKESISWHNPRLNSDFVDMFVNLLGYMPIGILATILLRRANSNAVFVSTLTGGLLSLAFESAQMYLPQRDSSLRDVLFNTLGSLVGSLGVLALRRSRPHLKVPWPSLIAGGLMLLWVFWQMYPFFPLLKRYKLAELVAQLPLWNFRGAEFGDVFLAAFLLYAFTVHSGQERWVSALIVAAVLALTLLGQSFVPGLSYSNVRIAGAAMGLILAAMVWRSKDSTWWIALAALICAWIVYREFYAAQNVFVAQRGAHVRGFAGQMFMAGAVLASFYRALFLPRLAPAGLHSRRHLV